MTVVPAGPFCIHSLGNAIRGPLEVKVTEQNGEERNRMRVADGQVNQE